MLKELRNEINLIFKKGIIKGYPVKSLKKWNNQGKEIASRPKSDKNNTKKYRNITTTSMDHKIREILGKENVEVVSRKNNSLFAKIRNEKDRRHRLETPGIYKIPLERGGDRIYYIGRTQKTINVRVGQHKEDVKRKVNATTLANAVVYEGWTPRWESTEVISRTRTLTRSILDEYLEIRKAKDEIVNSVEISERWEAWRKAIGEY